MNIIRTSLPLEIKGESTVVDQYDEEDPEHVFNGLALELSKLDTSPDWIRLVDLSISYPTRGYAVTWMPEN